jgi:hypothetical protein
MTLEQILKTKGYTDADLEALKPLLSDSRFRTSMEEQFGALETERNTFKANFEAKETEIEDWRTTVVNPRIAAAEQETVKARTEAAVLREQVQIAKDYGLIPEGEKASAPPSASATPGNEAFDPSKHNLVTRDEIGRFADLEGQAIAMAHDIGEEYRYLSGGKSLYDYVAPDGKRGMQALRAEAIKAKVPTDQYVAQKFDFAGKRQAIESKRQEEHDAQVAKDAVSKHILENGANPNTRTPGTSRSPFIPRPQGTSPAGGAKQPWEVPAQERRNARQERAITHLATERLN